MRSMSPLCSLSIFATPTLMLSDQEISAMGDAIGGSGEEIERLSAAAHARQEHVRGQTPAALSNPERREEPDDTTCLDPRGYRRRRQAGSPSPPKLRRRNRHSHEGVQRYRRFDI